jgi:hypothetical protein
MSDWHPMEMAPKEAIFWVVPRPDSLDLWPDFAPPHTGRRYMGKAGTWSSLETATHWMPLPDPPESSS